MDKMFSEFASYDLTYVETSQLCNFVNISAKELCTGFFLHKMNEIMQRNRDKMFCTFAVTIPLTLKSF